MPHKRKRKQRKPSFWREFSFEIRVTSLIIIGVFLILEEMEIKETAWYWIKYISTNVGGFLADLAQQSVDVISQIEVSDIVGFIMIIIAIVMMIGRVRRKMMIRHSTLYSCPNCDIELQRKHRTPFHRFLELTLFVKIKHYSCNKCSFDGIQIVDRR